MADCHPSVEVLQFLFTEYLGHETHVGVDLNGPAIERGDAGAFLTSMLKGEQAEKSKAAGVAARCVNPNHPALFPRAVKRGHRLVGPSPAIHHVILHLLRKPMSRRLSGPLTQLPAYSFRLSDLRGKLSFHSLAASLPRRRPETGQPASSGR